MAGCPHAQTVRTFLGFTNIPRAVSYAGPVDTSGTGEWKTMFDRIKALIWGRKIVKEVHVDTAAIKAGVKTSEFWLTLVGVVIPVLNQYLGLNIPTEAVMGILGVIGTYSVSRGVAKKSA